MTSWAQHAQNLVGANLSEAGIFGLNGSQWGASSGFKISAPELTAIVNGFSASGGEALRASGIKINGAKYMCLQANDSMILGKIKDGGVTIQKAKTALVIGLYGTGKDPGTANLTIGKFVDWLKNSNM